MEGNATLTDWTAPTVRDLFSSLTTILAEIPEPRRHNLYYTAYETGPNDLTFARSNCIAFEVVSLSGYDFEPALYSDVVLRALGIPRGESIGQVVSRDRIQFLVGQDTYVQDLDYFSKCRGFYVRACQALQNALDKSKLPGSVNTTIFNHDALLPLPGCWHRHKDTSIMYSIMQPNISLHSWMLGDAKLSDVVEVGEEDADAYFNGLVEVNELLGSDVAKNTPNVGKLASKTQDVGFYNKVIRDGREVLGKPRYMDLVRCFDREHQFKTIDGSEIVYTWRKTHWSEITPTKMKEFAGNKFDPDPSDHMCKEFIATVRRNNIISLDWFTERSRQKINFANGILDLEKDVFTAGHDPQCGMTYVLPYNYDPQAEATKFEKFLLDITDDVNIADLLMEFVGYAISGEPCWAHKCLMLLGAGRNGKSVFLNIMKALVGPTNYSTVMLDALEKDTSRYLLVDKLFNIGEETPDEALLESSNFKNLVAGGHMTVKQLWSQEYQVHNRTKLIFAANDMPRIKNIGTSILQRFLIVPFEQEFTPEKGNQDSDLENKLRTELPGIMNLAINGYKRLKKAKKFQDIEKMQKMTQELQESNNPVYLFKEDKLVVILDWEEQKIETGDTKERLYESYTAFCEASGYKALANVHFFRKLKALIPDLDQRTFRHHGAKRLLRGIRLQYEGMIT